MHRCCMHMEQWAAHRQGLWQLELKQPGAARTCIASGGGGGRLGLLVLRLESLQGCRRFCLCLLPLGGRHLLRLLQLPLEVGSPLLSL